MSTTETRLALAEATVLADEVYALLRDSCDRVATAGSIRRQKPDIGDLELVAIPKITRSLGGLFGDEGTDENWLDFRIAQLLNEGTLAPRLDKNGRKALGGHYKRLSYRGMGLDLFIPTPETWGCVFLIRTGSADFVHKLVTIRLEGGGCPDNMRFKDGRLWRIDADEGEILYGGGTGRWQRIPTPEEEDVFHELGQPFVAPEDRR